MDLAEFLLARIGEDEAVARAATPGPWYIESQMTNPPKPVGVLTRRNDITNDAILAHHVANPADMVHLAHWHPARILAECEAKRRIVERYRTNWAVAGGPTLDVLGWTQDREAGAAELARVLRLLALPYTEHSDYEEAWRP